MTKKKSLVDKIKDRQSSQKVSGRNRGVVAVIAQKEEISDALAHGFTMREIHTVLAEEGKMPVSYNAFTRLVNIYIKGKKQSKAREPKGAGEAFKKEKKSNVYNPDDYDTKDLY